MRVVLALAVLVAAAVAQTSVFTPLASIPYGSYSTTTAAGAKVSIYKNFQAGDTLSIPSLPGNFLQRWDAANHVLVITYPLGGNTITSFVNVLRTLQLTISSSTTNVERFIRWEIDTWCSSSTTYQLVSSGATWYNAVYDCSLRYSSGNLGYLATAESSAKDSTVTSAGGGQHTWVGGNCDQSVGTWRWRTGPLGLTGTLGSGNQGTFFSSGGSSVGGWYVNWAGGEPNNSGGEYCLELYNSANWNDLNCGNGLAYVCQYTATQYLHAGAVLGQNNGINSFSEQPATGACTVAPPVPQTAYCCPEVAAECTSLQGICNGMTDEIAGLAAAGFTTIASAATTLQNSCNRLYNDCHSKYVSTC